MRRARRARRRQSRTQAARQQVQAMRADGPLLRRVPWAARQLGVSKRVFYSMVVTRAIPEHVVLLVGRAVYVRVPAFDEWVSGRDGKGGHVG